MVVAGSVCFFDEERERKCSKFTIDLWKLQKRSWHERVYFRTSGELRAGECTAVEVSSCIF
jgi:hypothetical protein